MYDWFFVVKLKSSVVKLIKKIEPHLPWLVAKKLDKTLIQSHRILDFYLLECLWWLDRFPFQWREPWASLGWVSCGRSFVYSWPERSFQVFPLWSCKKMLQFSAWHQGSSVADHHVDDLSLICSKSSRGPFVVKPCIFVAQQTPVNLPSLTLCMAATPIEFINFSVLSLIKLLKKTSRFEIVSWFLCHYML